MAQFRGRISFKHLVEGADGMCVEDQAKVQCLDFVSRTGVSRHCFIYEEGTVAGEPHCHFYFESSKSVSTLIKNIKQAFRLPDRVRLYALKKKKDKSIHICSSFLLFFFFLYLQAYSLTAADPAKLQDYFVYLAKGVYGKRGDRVALLIEEPCERLWAVMHEQYHNVREERLAVAVSGDFYHELAGKCVAERKTSKEDVLAMVVRHYVCDAKKGFSRFQIEATFGRVFSLVNGGAALEFYIEVASSSLFRI